MAELITGLAFNTGALAEQQTQKTLRVAPANCMRCSHSTKLAASANPIQMQEASVGGISGGPVHQNCIVPTPQNNPPRACATAELVKKWNQGLSYHVLFGTFGCT